MTVLRFTPPPVTGLDAPSGNDKPAEIVRLARPSAGTRGEEYRSALGKVLAFAIVWAIASWFLGCRSPEPRPLPAPELPAQIDRIELGIVTHELALCRAGLGGYAR